MNLDFSEALDALKDGYKIARENWNGNGMYVVLQKGYPNGIAADKNTLQALNIPEGTIIGFRPYLMMVCPKGSTNHWKTDNELDCCPWLPSCTDILAEDWKLVG